MASFHIKIIQSRQISNFLIEQKFMFCKNDNKCEFFFTVDGTDEMRDDPVCPPCAGHYQSI